MSEMHRTATAPAPALIAARAQMADAAARRLGFAPSQRDAYYTAIVAAPFCGPRGEAIDLHALGIAAARRTGYAGDDHP